MESLLLAGANAFDLDGLAKILSNEFTTDLQDKVSDIRHLIVKNSAGFVAQIQSCDEDEDADTVDDIRHIGKSTLEFETAAKNGLRFLIVTYEPAQKKAMQAVIDAFVAAGVVHYDCSVDVLKLTA